jgi:hypothetical protein
MDNHVEEYFVQKETQAGNELFRVDNINVDIKSQVSEAELRLITILMMNDDFLSSRGIPRMFDKYYYRFLRLKVSLDRQGRKEYVDINKRDNSDDTIKKLGQLDSLTRKGA